MDKKFTKFFLDNGFEIDKNNARGTMLDYDVQATIVMLDNVSPLRMFVPCYIDMADVGNVLNDIKALKIKYFRFEYQIGYGLVLGFNGLTVGGLLKQLKGYLESILNILKNHGALGPLHCPHCGKELPKEKAKEVDFFTFKVSMDEECIANINKEIEEENKEFEEAPNNYFKGFLGALIGGIAGIVLSDVLYFFGFMSAWSALLSIFLGRFLYKKFGGKQNKMMIVIVTSVTVIAMAFAVFEIYGSVAVEIAKDAGVTLTPLDAFQYSMQNVDGFTSAFIYDFILMMVFTIVGAVFGIIGMAAQIKRKKTIETK